MIWVLISCLNLYAIKKILYRETEKRNLKSQRDRRDLLYNSPFAQRLPSHLTPHPSAGAVHAAVANGLLTGLAGDGALELEESAADAVAHGGLAACRGGNGQHRRPLGPAVVVAKEAATRSAGRGACGADLGARGPGTAAEKAGARTALCFCCSCGGRSAEAEAETVAVSVVAVMVMAMGGACCASVGREEAAGGAGLIRRVVPMHFEGFEGF